jgi:hypothetical protein
VRLLYALVVDLIEHLQVLRKSMGAPLRLTSLVVKQVLSCLTAELGQAGIARFRANSLSVLRVLEVSPMPLPPSVAPHGIQLASQAVDDDSAVIAPPRVPILETPAGRFATASALLQCGFAHTAAMLAQAHVAALPAQLRALQRQSSIATVEEVLMWLHTGLTIQGAHLLPAGVRDGMLAALKVCASLL